MIARRRGHPSSYGEIAPVRITHDFANLSATGNYSRIKGGFRHLDFDLDWRGLEIFENEGDHEILALPDRISWCIIVCMIDRQTDIAWCATALKRSRVVAVLGPRQCGKTTLARQFVPADSINYFDLEDPQSLARLSEPDTALRPLKGLVVIDEIQRRPELFPLLRVWPIASRSPARFLILGSARPICSANPRKPWPAAWKPCPWKAFVWPIWAHSARPALAARRVPAGVYGQERSGFDGLAPAIPADLSGTRHPATGHPDSGRRPAALLEHAGPLSRPNLERRRAGPRAGGQRTDRAPLPRSLDRRLHAPAIAALVRKSRQAPGQGAEGLRARQRPAARASGHRQPARPGASSQGRRLVGRLRRRGSAQGSATR